jgi:hypothetical protein
MSALRLTEKNGYAFVIELTVRLKGRPDKKVG